MLPAARTRKATATESDNAFANFPLASHVIASPSNHLPPGSQRAGTPPVPERFRKYCSENVLSGHRLHNFLSAVPCGIAAGTGPETYRLRQSTAPAAFFRAESGVSRRQRCLAAGSASEPVEFHQNPGGGCSDRSRAMRLVNSPPIDRHPRANRPRRQRSLPRNAGSVRISLAIAEVTPAARPSCA